MTALRLSACVLLWLLLPTFKGSAQSKPELPPASLQGKWTVERHFFRALQEGESNFEDLGEESKGGEFAPSVEILFRIHESGAIQRYWTDRSGKLVSSKGITIIQCSSNEVTFRPWSDHPTWKTILRLKDDGTATLQMRSLKHQETFLLTKSKNGTATAPKEKEADAASRPKSGG